MKNKSLSIFLAAVILLSFVTLAKAVKNGNGAGDGAATGTSGQGPVAGQQTVTASPSQPAMQIKNQVETKNQGEDSQLMIETKQETASGTASSNLDIESQRNETAQEKMSEVAEQVEELLANKTIKGGIGEQVRQIATEQKMAQEQVKVQMNQVENRKGLLKSLIGPDFTALKSMEKQVENNQLRIEQLTELKTQLTNQSDIAVIEETIQALTEQNTELQETVVKENQSKSMLGWLFRFFAK